jgi:hypothetical protein
LLQELNGMTPVNERLYTLNRIQEEGRTFHISLQFGEQL